MRESKVSMIEQLRELCSHAVVQSYEHAHDRVTQSRGAGQARSAVLSLTSKLAKVGEMRTRPQLSDNVTKL